MNNVHLTVEEANFLSCYSYKNKQDLLLQIKIGMEAFDSEMKQLACKMIDKVKNMEESEFNLLEIYPTDE